MKKTTVGIVLSLFLIPTLASAMFWDNWVSTRQFESNYQSQVQLLNKQDEIVKELGLAKKQALVAFNNAMEQRNRLAMTKFMAHCTLYSAKKNSGIVPEDSRIEPACENDDLNLYNRIYGLENFTTVINQ